MTELGKRTLTAITMAVIVFSVILFAPNICVYALLTLVLFVATWEWGRLIFSANWLVFSVLALTCICFWLFHQTTIVWILYAAGVIGLIIQCVIYCYRPMSVLVESKILRLIFAVCILVGACSVLNYMLLSHQKVYLIFLIVLVSVIDISAYFVGKAFGVRKLSISLSPKKTWAGVFGAWLAANIITFVYFNWAWPPISWVKVLSYTLCYASIAVVLALFGDLAESMQKRIKQVKDSSSILPGHGGALDRLDAILFLLLIVPVFEFFWP